MNSNTISACMEKKFVKTIDIPYRLCYYIQVREKTKQSATLTLARNDATRVYIAQYHRQKLSVGVMGVWASVHAFFSYKIIEGHEIIRIYLRCMEVHDN